MPDLQEKAKVLLAELRYRERKAHRLAVRSHYANVAAMLLTLGSLVIEFCYGLLPNHTSQKTAALGLIPGGIALFAGSLRFEDRARFHFQKAHRLDAILRAAEYGWSDPVTQGELQITAKALTDLSIQMEAEWDKCTALGWNRFNGQN